MNFFNEILPERLKVKQQYWYMAKYSYKPGLNAFFESWNRAYEYIWRSYGQDGIYFIGDTIFSAGGAEFAKIVKVDLNWSEVK